MEGRCNQEDSLMEYTEREFLYREYHRLAQQNDKYKIRQLLSALPPQYIERNRIILPEISSPRFRIEGGTIIQNELLQWAGSQPDILMEKHPRYLPEFIHGHAYVELMYLYRGQCRNRFSHTVMSMQEGDVCIIAPRVKHGVSIFDDSILINVQIKPQAIARLFTDISEEQNPLLLFFQRILQGEKQFPYLFVRTGTSPNLRGKISDAFGEYCSEKPYGRKIAVMYLQLFFALMIREYSSIMVVGAEEKSNAHKIGLILDYIQKHSREIDLQSLAGNFHYTPQYMSKIIREYTGVPFSCLVRRLRLEQAAYLLRCSEKAIPVIAREVGYRDTDHFIRLFKAQYQYTPLKYRQSHQ